MPVSFVDGELHHGAKKSCCSDIDSYGRYSTLHLPDLIRERVLTTKMVTRGWGAREDRRRGLII
jgi:hypothetical protein